MNKTTALTALILLFPAAGTYSQTQRDNSGRPCYDVNIQVDRNNRSTVKQDCAFNDSRTMQAGQTNDATTVQRGETNVNEVRQYGFEGAARRR